MHRYGHLFSTLNGLQNTQGHLWTLLRLSHGENRGSSPLGSANQINGLYRIGHLYLFPSPIFLQINNRTRGTGLLRVLVPPISY
jgi:hypothetical protein